MIQQAHIDRGTLGQLIGAFCLVSALLHANGMLAERFYLMSALLHASCMSAERVCLMSALLQVHMSAEKTHLWCQTAQRA